MSSHSINFTRLRIFSVEQKNNINYFFVADRHFNFYSTWFQTKSFYSFRLRIFSFSLALTFVGINPFEIEYCVNQTEHKYYVFWLNYNLNRQLEWNVVVVYCFISCLAAYFPDFFYLYFIFRFCSFLSKTRKRIYSGKQQNEFNSKWLKQELQLCLQWRSGDSYLMLL